MNILKKWRNSDRRNETSSALSKRGSRHNGGGTDMIARLRDEMDQAFDRVWNDLGRDPFAPLGGFDLPALANRGIWPAVDSSEDEKAVTLRVEVPGLDERDLDVEISGNLLTVRGTKHQDQDDKKHGRFERFTGTFMRTLTLPDYVDPAGVEARYAKGVLTLTVPKVPGKGPRRVKVGS